MSTADARAAVTCDAPSQQVIAMTDALVRLDLPVNPVPLARQRYDSVRRRTYNTAAVSAFYDEFRWWARLRGPAEPLSGELALTLYLWRRCRGGARGDLSNLVKAIEDAGNPTRDGGWQGLWRDDRQIVEYGHVRLVEHGPHVAGRILLIVSRPSSI